MGWKILCRDLGLDCSCIVRGETDKDIMVAYGEHVETVHGFEAKRILFDRKMINKLRKAIQRD